MIKHIMIQLTKTHSYGVRVHHKNLRYWTSWELGRYVFFPFLILIPFAPDLLTPLFIVWLLEKFWGWENLRHSRFIKYIEYQGD